MIQKCLFYSSVEVWPRYQLFAKSGYPRISRLQADRPTPDSSKVGSIIHVRFLWRGNGTDHCHQALEARCLCALSLCGETLGNRRFPPPLFLIGLSPWPAPIGDKQSHDGWSCCVFSCTAWSRQHAQCQLRLATKTKEPSAETRATPATSFALLAERPSRSTKTKCRRLFASIMERGGTLDLWHVSLQIVGVRLEEKLYNEKELCSTKLPS